MNPNKRTGLNLSVSEIRDIILVVIGLISLIYYYTWWLRTMAQGHLWLIPAMIVAVAYGLGQIVPGWLVYLAAHRQQPMRRSLSLDLTVDVFVTAYKEDPMMVADSLYAAHSMRGEHTTWLLDDGKDPALHHLANTLGVGYLTRESNTHAKAGNINAALARTGGDIIVIFDVDHIPEPDFLAKTLPFFDDPGVGFVQAMPTFYNDQRGWVATASVESSLDFYNPTSKGMDGLHSVTKMGTNALIRRKALEEIGGYQPGLAEDLATSFALHAAGWRSRYAAEPLAPGLAPPDLTAWFVQQFKWARGVFEVFVTQYFKQFPNLSWPLRIVYSVRMTNYWIGVVIALHILALLIGLFIGQDQVNQALQTYLLYLIPLATFHTLIRGLALRRWRHSSLHMRSLYRAVTLIFNTWPIYTVAWLMAMFRLPLSFRPTPKQVGQTTNPRWIIVQLASAILLCLGLTYNIATLGLQKQYWVLYSISFSFALIQFGLLRTLLRLVWATLLKARLVHDKKEIG